METRNTRDELLQAGLRRLRAKGYAATGVKEILDEAKVPKGSFYHYFPSKEAFTEQVVTLHVREGKERTARILVNGRGAPLSRLRRYFQEMITVFGPGAPVSGCLLGNLSLEIADHSDAIQSLLRRSFSDWQAAIAAVLREAKERGDLPASANPEELAAFLLNSYEGALLRSKADRSRKPLETFMSFAFDVALQR